MDPLTTGLSGATTAQHCKLGLDGEALGMGRVKNATLEVYFLSTHGFYTILKLNTCAVEPW